MAITNLAVFRYIDGQLTMIELIPGDRMGQTRYPQSKQRYLGGVNIPTSFGAITEAIAYSGTDAARIGFHNEVKK